MIILEGNAFYEIDEECLEKKAREQEQDEGVKEQSSLKTEEPH